MNLIVNGSVAFPHCLCDAGNQRELPCSAKQQQNLDKREKCALYTQALAHSAFVDLTQLACIQPIIVVILGTETGKNAKTRDRLCLAQGH